MSGGAAGPDETLAIEAAARRAWPALEQVEDAGWVVRAAGGYTRRANCATALAADGAALEERIAWSERELRARGLPAVFRVLSSAGPAGLDAALAAAGYRREDESLVMTLDLAEGAPGPGAVPLRALSLDGWLDLFDRVGDKRGEQRAMHRAMLDAIRAERLLAAVESGGAPVGCGLAVRDGPLVGLFDLAIAPALRGRGHGRRLLDGLLRWGAERGGRRAYLQVLASNHVAVALYERAGFRVAYRYWYRMPPR